ncbi:AAA family ATPase [Limosilactobacillus reuteri]|uniref:AAA family ATPase n=1 Tax=Limosilactobacillus reuteri TaxID=1598 RepID=UPI002B05C679|nr:AAA family ATPase [Limosilactobacillus reuteri]
MSILPPNKPQKARKIPRNYFIYGDTMSGKSYLAERFPAPLFLNTDGNSEMNTAPSIQLKNVRKSDGSLKKSIIDQLDEIILALGTENHGYKTVVIDVIDDVVTLIEQAICYDNGVETLGDVPYGKGWSQFNTVFQAFVTELKALPLNTVYISRLMTLTDETSGHTEDRPSLKQKYYNVVNGNCDLVIETKRFGDRYIRMVKDRRIHYVKDDITDPAILRVLEHVNGVFDKPKTTSIKEQNEIVNKIKNQKVKEG